MSEFLMIHGQHWRLIINKSFFPCSEAKLKKLCKYIDSDTFAVAIKNYFKLYDYLESMSVYMGKIHYKPREQKLFDNNFESIRNLMLKRGYYK